MRPTVIVSIHDVAPSTTDATLTWLHYLDQRHIPASLLVVTGPWDGPPLLSDRPLLDRLRQAVARGHEVSFHGVDHMAVRVTRHRDHTRALSGRVLARGCAEFATLDAAEATRRLTSGLSDLAAAGFEVAGFNPPGWLMSPGTLEALRHTGLRYATTQWHVRELSTWRRLRIPALSHRPDSALALTAAQAFWRIGRRRLDHGRATRIALHPRDLDDRRLVSATLALLDHARALDARFTTYHQLVHRWVTPTVALAPA